MIEAIYYNGEKRKTILLHIAGWCVFVLYIYITNYLADHNLKIIPTVLFLVPHLLTFYIVLYFLNLRMGKKILWGIAVFFIVFIIMATASYIFFYFLLPIFGLTLYNTKEFASFFQSAVLGYVQFFIFALLYFYFSNNVRKERALRLLNEENALVTQQKITQELDNALLREKEMEMEQERMEIENAFFQSQINPHFLYNTLNVLFSQALKIAPALATNISNMSEIIRYSMENSAFKVKAVNLQKELDHLQILIDINALRFGKEYFVDYTIEGYVEDQIIPPLVLITAVENAFKYGDIRDSENPLTIKVTLRPGHMHFYCRNKKRQHNPSFPSHNIGIKNLHYRLDVAFQDRFHIETINEDEFYTFKLIINSI